MSNKDYLPSWLSLGLVVIAEGNVVSSGGIRRSSSGRVLTTLEAAIDLGDLFHREGAGTLVAIGQTIRAESGGSLDSGDIQVYSNLESDENRDDIVELWYERLFPSIGGRLQFGKMDANAEFAYVDAAGDFSSSSAGFSPTIFVFPSYPDPATSVNLFVDTGSPWADSSATLAYGLYDGALGVDGVRTGRRGPSTFFSNDRSGDFFHVLQWETVTEHGSGQESRTTLGAWLHTGDFERFDGGREDNTEGAFATWERSFLRSSVEEHHVHLFGQYGWADDDVSAIGQHFAAGVVVEALLPHRPEDRAGLYASFVDLTGASSPNTSSNELSLDAYYRMQWSERLWIQPEVQWIIDPSGDEQINDALVLGLRIGAEF